MGPRIISIPREQGLGCTDRSSRRNMSSRVFIRLRGDRGRSAPRRVRGLTMIEIVVALSVLVVAASIFCQMLIGTTRLRQLNRENALAGDAARVIVERMRNAPFLEVYRRYNEYPDDDPLGKGTGPGHLFDVPGLTPVEGAPQGKAGQILFPSRQVQVTVTTTTGIGKLATTTTSTATQWHLREDFEDEELGFPRDLNGDNVVDTANHGTDYIVLPVRIRVSWQSPTGARHFELVTQLGDFKPES